MRHLLVTNDFPPKVGGIQSYLWELWRRLPPSDVTVLTTPHDGAAAFDAEQPYRVIRDPDRVLLPTPALRRRITSAAREVGAEAVVFDPAMPVGLLGPAVASDLGVPWAVVLHGAEVTVPGRLPGAGHALGRLLSRADLLVCAGTYPEAEARRAIARAGAGLPVPPVVQVPPGVDTERFRPFAPEERAEARRRLGLAVDGRLVVGVSRLVPRKGFDVLIRAAARLAPDRPDLAVAIAGGGRDEERLDRLVAETGAPVCLLGRVDDADLPALYGAADVFAMVCRTRWGGLEQEGFGIVFLEAAACAVPQVAGASGGADEAVADGETGVVVRDPSSVDEVTAALASLLDDPARRERLGAAARARAVERYRYDRLADDLGAALDRLASRR